MDEILSDSSKFELLNDDAIKLTLKRESRQVKTLLKRLKSNNCINERIYNELCPSGTRIGILYGLPKIHKSSIPLRPILSSINHYSYKIVKFFIPFLTLISTSSFVIKDSFSFVQELLNSDINPDSVVMASFGVTSLFSNIPVEETIEIISNHIFANCMYYEGFDRSQFIKLLSLSVKNCHFIFNGRIYQQIDGVAMGSHLGPLFVNIFMFSMRNHGFTTVLLLPNLFCIDVMLMTFFFFSNLWTAYHFFLTILTNNILTYFSYLRTGKRR